MFHIRLKCLYRGISLGQKNGYRLFQLDENDKPSPEKDKDDKSGFIFFV